MKISEFLIGKFLVFDGEIFYIFEQVCFRNDNVISGILEAILCMQPFIQTLIHIPVEYLARMRYPFPKNSWYQSSMIVYALL